jgi:quinol monooxygenase YgiN
MYRIVWQFDADPDRVAEFEREYGGDGAWARLFRAGDGFLGTELFRSIDHPARFVTVDRWSSRAAYDAFRTARAREYAAVDTRCERLTRAEELVARGEES